MRGSSSAALPLPATPHPAPTVARPSVEERVEDIRRHLINGLPYGSQKAIAERLHRGKDRISKELYGRDGLSVDTLTEAFDELRTRGLDDLAQALHELLDIHEPTLSEALKSRRLVGAIRYPNSTWELRFR